MHLLPIVLVAVPVVWGIAASCRDLLKVRSTSWNSQPGQLSETLPSATVEPLGYIDPGADLKSAAYAVSEGVHTAEVGFGSAIEQMGHFLHH